MFSKACEYGIRALIYVTVQSLEGKRSGLKDIAKEIDTPEAFTAKILQILVKNNLICSVKGPNGGFLIDRGQMEKIKLSHIVTVIDGNTIYEGCGLGIKECSELRPCPLHEKFKAIRTELKDMLENTNIYELALGLKEGLTFFKGGSEVCPSVTI